ncbi:hypothetical protein K4F52_007737 [Lecanicillium sp. MT-2017a]|nr:hypothetical protein K4F52_007737 [Lecanicillium sp. MT-2017a]
MGVKEMSSHAELTTLLETTTYVAVDFYADWCPPCKAIGPVFAQLAEQHALDGVLAFAKVNTDKVQQAAAQHRITAMPTFLFFKDGKQVLVNGQLMIQGANPSALKAAAEKLGGLAAKKKAEQA